jgi:hypothetical protein
MTNNKINFTPVASARDASSVPYSPSQLLLNSCSGLRPAASSNLPVKGSLSALTVTLASGRRSESEVKLPVSLGEFRILSLGM